MNIKRIFSERFNSIEKLYRILFYLLCITLLVSSFIKFGGALNRTKIGVGDLKVRLDHFLHALAYLIFSMYYYAGKLLGLNLFKNRTHLFFFLVLFVVGFLAETIQIWVPYRSFTFLDLLSNLVGISLGYVVTTILIRLHPVRQG
jgi:VanZ family protein